MDLASLLLIIIAVSVFLAAVNGAIQMKMTSCHEPVQEEVLYYYYVYEEGKADEEPEQTADSGIFEEGDEENPGSSEEAQEQPEPAPQSSVEINLSDEENEMTYDQIYEPIYNSTMAMIDVDIGTTPNPGDSVAPDGTILRRPPF